MARVVCFGELLMRLVPSPDGKWLSDSVLPVFVGGAEANVAVALSKWGVATSYVTALPQNFLGDQLTHFLASRKIDTSHILYFGDRVGLYYLPQSGDLKTGGVIYDRANSSFATIKRKTIDWDWVFQDVEWLHFSAICPALNEEIAKVCEEALLAANRRGIKVSLDLNYRSKLWQYGRKPAEVMPLLARHCDLIMGNIWAAETMLNIPIDQELLNSKQKQSYLEHSRISSKEILKQYSNCKLVANTFRFTDENEKITYYATLYSNGKIYTSNEYSSEKVVEKVGSGDCFMAGLLYGCITNLSNQEIIDFATAAAFQKLFVEGDSTDMSVAEIVNTIR